ncbi:hypothetical protein NDU88_002274 [Pleurodeles waltl]|uniref:Uncharacterized protein n=1 Tax=Pleurodeles waltl TaxID=8319 RepID=A0AAV7NMM4_PLEWA|nr:hypothetical protein NDU88_002274 [Pleurodeles waltl]
MSKRVFAPALAKMKLQGAPPLLQQGNGSRRGSQPAAGAPGVRGDQRTNPPLRYELRDRGVPPQPRPPPRFESFRDPIEA